MGFLDGLDSIWKATQQAAGAVAGAVEHGAADVAQVAAAPFGVAFDVARQLPGTDFLNHGFLANISTGSSLHAAADGLISEGKLTGWTLTQAGQGINYAWHNGIEVPVEVAMYGADGVGWSQAWKLAKERDIMQTGQLVANDWAKGIGGALGTSPGNIIGSLPIVGAYLNAAGVGTPEASGVRAGDDDAWKKLHAVSPFWSGAVDSVGEFGLQWATDPFVLASKATAGARLLRNARPVLPGEEANLAERMGRTPTPDASGKLPDVTGETSHPVMGVIPSKKAGFQSRTDPLIGTVKYEDHLQDGKPLLDANGQVIQTAVQKDLGWLDGANGAGRSAADIFYGLRLQTNRYGNALASLLARTAKIEDVGQKVNIRRDILATAGGDMGAFERLRAQSSDPEYADVLSNLFQGKGDGSLIAAENDAANADKIAGGAAEPTYTDPSVVASVQTEHENQAGFSSWLVGVNRERTLAITPAGERAVARIHDQGLGRDGTLHTGRAALDNIVNDQILGKFKSSGSVVDDAIASSPELTPGAAVRDAKIYTPDEQVFSRGPDQMPGIFVKAGLKTLGWSTGAIPLVKGAAKASDALRNTVLAGGGMLPLHDAGLVTAITQTMLHRAGVDPDQANSLLSRVIQADSETKRSAAVLAAQDTAKRTIGERYGVDSDIIDAVSQKHGRLADSTLAAIRGQAFTTAEQAPIGPEAAQTTRGDAVFLPGDGGTTILPVYNTQTANSVPVMDLDYVEKWLKRDSFLAGVSSLRRNIMPGTNEAVARADALGFNSTITNRAKIISDHINDAADRANNLWKRAILLTRFGSFAIRNTVEEQMRTWALHMASEVAEESLGRAVHGLREMTRKLPDGGQRFRDNLDGFAAVEAQKVELEHLQAIHSDPGVVAQYKTAKAHLNDIGTQHAQALENGDDLTQLNPTLQLAQEQPALFDNATRVQNMKALKRSIKDSEAALHERVLAGSGTSLLPGHGDAAFPDAYNGPMGEVFHDLISNGGQFDKAMTGVEGRAHEALRGVGSRTILDVSHPATSAEDVQTHLAAWAQVLNLQVAQDPAGRIALQAMANKLDKSDVQQAVKSWLDSPASAKYRSLHPVPSRDTEQWAGVSADTTMGLAHDDQLASALLEGPVSQDRLAEMFPQTTTRPPVHVAGLDSVMGNGGAKQGALSNWMFKRIDKMSLEQVTRHPTFTVFFNGERERLANDYLRLQKEQYGDDARVSLDQINALTQSARDSAALKVKQMFYDVHAKSSAAQYMRFVYPFFAAHQDGLTFWGKAIAQNPAVLRKLQLGFQFPNSLGLVVDQNGNPVKSGTFVDQSHQMLLQMPKSWGGDGTPSGLTVPLNAFNLILQNGAILDPGAGPIASVSAGYIQSHWAPGHPDLEKALTWFNPFGAPKTGDQPALPNALGMQYLDPALPTPVKRLATLWDAYHQQNSREYNQMWGIQAKDKVVQFSKDNGRPPNEQETNVLASQAGDAVRHMALLRFGASLASPAQPKPTSIFSGYLNEYRRLETQGRNENRGPFWATDQFLNQYGDAYIALTKSDSENRAHLAVTDGSVASLNAHEKLTNVTDPELWRIIVGNEGAGAFSIDAYRWMQNKNLSNAGSGTLIDTKDVRANIFSAEVGAGWRAVTRVNNALTAMANQQGLTSYSQSPQLAEMHKKMQTFLVNQYPQWASSLGGNKDFDLKLWPGIQAIAQDKGLLNDPARPDIGTLAQYVQGRKFLMDALAQRANAGGTASIKSGQNKDLALAYAQFLGKLQESNTVFSDYAFPGIISKDPLYISSLVGGN